MRSILIFFLMTFICSINAQRTYFQQDVAYDIQATLDDQLYTLTGEVNLDYKNNSPDTLKEMYFHVWTNAYKNNSTAWAQQVANMGREQFYFSKDSDRGGYDNIQFFIGGQEVASKTHKGNIDVLKIVLPQPLFPGRSIQIRIPFAEKIPAPFSRMGRDKNAFQISQWYPKPAVYDHLGWHPIPYLDQGEFYSEFGTFKVKLTLPADYIVAATGTLETPSEREYLEQIFDKTKDFIKSETINSTDWKPTERTGMKTISYTAKNVHDFAWFANKLFLGQQDQITLASGSKVNTYCFYTPDVAKDWSKAIKFVNRSVEFYSNHVGEYPYEQATAVFGPLDAGGGMEYPMITVINQRNNLEAIDLVITHEVGHNWFYGILGSNERLYPWMDEGVNSYYEERYMKTYYPDTTKKSGLLNLLKSPEKIVKKYNGRYHYDQALGLPADEYSSLNYGVDIYKNTAYALELMQHQLGTWIFDKSMQQYYLDWKFKHPYPEDMKNSLTKKSSRNIDWFFDDLQNRPDRIDYKISDIKVKDGKSYLTVENKSNSATPFSITTYKNQEQKSTIWFDGVKDSKVIEITDDGYDTYKLNAEPWSTELYKEDNNISAKGKKLPYVKFKMLSGVEKPDKYNIYWLPMVNYNVYDQLMVGATFHNIGLPGRKLEYIITPMYGFGTDQLTGNAFIQQQALNPNNNSRWFFRLNLRRYGYDRNETFDYTNTYSKIAPSVAYQFKYDPAGTVTKTIEYKSSLMNLKQGQVKLDTVTGIVAFDAYKNEPLVVNEVNYIYENKKAISPILIKTGLEHFGFNHYTGSKENQIRWISTLNTKFTYEPKTSVNFRFWGGVMLFDTRKSEDEGRIQRYPGSMSIFGRGYDDYRWEGLYLGRNERSGLSSTQIMSNQNGGFKDATNPAVDNGYSNTWVISGNVDLDLPFTPKIFPLKPYFDVAVGKLETKSAKPTKLFYSGGVMLDYDVLKIYFPLLYSNEIETAYNETRNKNFWSKITFSLDLQKFNPIIFKRDINKMIKF